MLMFREILCSKQVLILLVNLFIISFFIWRFLESAEKKLNAIILPAKVKMYPQFYNSIEDLQFDINDIYTQAGDIAYIKLKDFEGINRDIQFVGTIIGANIADGFFTVLPDDGYIEYPIIKAKIDIVSDFRVIYPYRY